MTRTMQAVTFGYPMPLPSSYPSRRPARLRAHAQVGERLYRLDVSAAPADPAPEAPLVRLTVGRDGSASPGTGPRCERQSRQLQAGGGDRDAGNRRCVLVPGGLTPRRDRRAVTGGEPRCASRPGRVWALVVHGSGAPT